MTAPQRAQADEQAPARSLPDAFVAVILVLGAAAGICYAMWLGANQCIKVGGCG